MKIYLASDHAGLYLKNETKLWLISNNYEVIDFGPHIYNNTDDYPDFIHEAARALSLDASNFDIDIDINSFAFVFGGSGTGEAIVMNRYKGVRCLEIYTSINHANIKDIVCLSRKHNNANSISFGARFLDIQEIKDVIEFLSAGGSDSPENIFKKIGINPNKKLFETGLKRVESNINELQKLWAKNKKSIINK